LISRWTVRGVNAFDVTQRAAECWPRPTGGVTDTASGDGRSPETIVVSTTFLSHATITQVARYYII